MNECGGSNVKARFSGQGLADTLKREKALNRKRHKQSKQQVRTVSAVSGEGGGPSASEGFEKLRSPDPGSPRSSVRDDTADGAVADADVEQKKTPESPQDMATRLYRAFAGQMDQLEARLADLFDEAGAGLPNGGLQEIDKTVKTLASLAKTLTALMDLKTDVAPDGEDDNLDDREELRAALARRLERLCEAGAD
ncbi:hypothetical protein J7444_06685 [Labrenzia sp. R4_1]|uniref:hypothetical protein n=1 Tax=Labrenzia sp. R4_1 TaxID=2821106 RepID=UPI001ADB348E|nr:hypothetical protein [Labrenzia sp. R4_1]MBO9424398.1 hypothetical protein [Labrenzia sp. R4_1]